MRDCSVPNVIQVPAGADLTDAVWANESDAPDAVVFTRKGAGGWLDVTAKEFATDVRALAAGLIGAGVEAGDRVALMSRTRYEWTLCDYAIWSVGAVTVPVYETSSAEQVAWILGDSGAVACIVETDTHAMTVATVRDQLPDVRHVWQIETGGLDRLRAAGEDVATAAITVRRAALTPESLATIIYTSGTTGRPKGCELTHGNFLFDARTTTETTKELFGDSESTLLFLPLAHVFARIIQVGCVENRTRMGHTHDIKNLLPDFASFRPTFILAVPRVFEKVYNTAKQSAHAAGKGRIFDAAEKTAIAYSQALDRGSVPLVLKARQAVFDRLVFARLRAALGGQVRYAVSGGAPLGERLGHFFRGTGLTILEGYGLTETTAGATMNLPEAIKVGTVGRPIAGTTVRIADDGEILLKGDNIFRGYWHNDQATAEALGDGFFHTGDIGDIDADGYLRITGRKKELIVTAGGKNVSPAVLEDRLRAHVLVSQCLVVGDSQPFIGALVTVDAEALPAWLTAHGRPTSAPVGDLVDDAELRAAVQGAVDDANKAVSHAEAIKKFRILPVDFTEEGGQLTPSLKLKRAVVAKEFAADIAAIYS